MKNVIFELENGTFNTNDSNFIEVLCKIAGQIRPERMFFNIAGEEITRDSAMEIDGKDLPHFSYNKKNQQLTLWCADKI